MARIQSTHARSARVSIVGENLTQRRPPETSDPEGAETRFEGFDPAFAPVWRDPDPGFRTQASLAEHRGHQK